VAASRAEGEETQRRASPEGRCRGGEGSPEGKSRGEEAAPEGSARRRGGASTAAPVTQYVAAAQVPRRGGRRRRTRGMTHGMPLFHLAVMQQHYKENIVLNTTTCNQVAWW